MSITSLLDLYTTSQKCDYVGWFAFQLNIQEQVNPILCCFCLFIAFVLWEEKLNSEYPISVHFQVIQIEGSFSINQKTFEVVAASSSELSCVQCAVAGFLLNLNASVSCRY
jgi:hypothetical protein